MGYFDKDPVVQAMKAAHAAGVVGSHFDVVGVFDPGKRSSAIHDALRKTAERHGLRIVSSSTGSCCLPCRGRGTVDDGTASGCVRRSMRCPTCLGRGRFVVTLAKRGERPDGWPLCPECGEDELGCMATPGPPDYSWTLARYLRHDLFCYRCCKVTWRPESVGGGE